MIYRSGGREYHGATAVEIVRQLERDAADYAPRDNSLREFLRWSLARLGDRIPARELDLSRHLDDETLTFDYLCLCDEYGIGGLQIVLPDAQLGSSRAPTT